MPRVRTFIALDPGPAIRERMVALQESLARTGAEVKWVEPENLHVTLKFIGEAHFFKIEIKSYRFQFFIKTHK